MELLSLKIFHLSDNIGVFEPNTIERLKKVSTYLLHAPTYYTMVNRARPDWAYEFSDWTGPDTQICQTGPAGPD